MRNSYLALFLFLVGLIFIMVEPSFAGVAGGDAFFEASGNQAYNLVRSFLFGPFGRTAILLLLAGFGAVSFFMQKWPVFIFLMVGLVFYLLLPTMMTALEGATAMVI